VQTATTSTTNHTTAQLQKDSVFVHDSIFVRIRADTVYLERWHTRWREKEIIRTDTIQVENIKVETKEVRYVPKFYKYCAALTALLLILLLLRVTLYLYRRFH
jgi:CDP-glycerol glycerophosphotransferase (TagB/SpsB family)